MPFDPGTRVGPYEIASAIGAGGMGEVYRARDTRLKRDVALKILPSSVASDPDRVARFHREAELLAALNHPNIAHIHGIEEAATSLVLVMELVDGEDLAARIVRGPIPLDEALPIARQIADALESAHERGIIHRDLKPANVKVRPDGAVKVLDFGLGEGLYPGGPGGWLEPGHFSNGHLTRDDPSRTIRTAVYMSPEQARGKPVDRRADIWAFGCAHASAIVQRPSPSHTPRQRGPFESSPPRLEPRAAWRLRAASSMSPMSRSRRRDPAGGIV